MKNTSLGTVLGQTIGNALSEYETVTIGSKINVKLEGGRHVAIGFHSENCVGHWSGIELRLVSNERGLLETQWIPFAEAFASLIDVSHPNKLEKYVWDCRGSHSWYGKPTPQDLKSLRAQVKAYLKLVG